DAKCGKIQCQGGANRPIIGTNAVSIENQHPPPRGGRILCRGTHVYLGDDMLTQASSCRAQSVAATWCQNASVFGVQECSEKCSGRGVCNNNKNCHCEAHWAPPFCDNAGFGGSVDSGPMRLADYGGVAVGVLLTLITFLGAGLIVSIKRKTLLRLLFTNKKNPMDKMRSVGPNRSSGPSHRDSPRGQPQAQTQTPPQRQKHSIFK
ncbi:disintegrin and metalloproteinase domain-containing protein 12, partial [Oncorhynchus keta]|uniref:disintegrin and metalloproteinase domain-containing protein 12 n=1 Tax=Oncorhynchus keta TaxID=8018 RepID=UPI00227AEC86